MLLTPQLLLVSLYPFSDTLAKSQVVDLSNQNKWTDEEIIELGYIPNEVIVKFKENKIFV